MRICLCVALMRFPWIPRGLFHIPAQLICAFQLLFRHDVDFIAAYIHARMFARNQHTGREHILERGIVSIRDGGTWL
jgi:hypothetical protein